MVCTGLSWPHCFLDTYCKIQNWCWCMGHVAACGEDFRSVREALFLIDMEWVMNTIYFVDTSVLFTNLDVLKRLAEDGGFELVSWAMDDIVEIMRVSTNANLRHVAEKAYEFLQTYKDKYRFTSAQYMDQLHREIRESLEKADVAYMTSNPTLYQIMTNKSFAEGEHTFEIEWVDYPHEVMDYTGFVDKSMTDVEMAYFYEHQAENVYDLLVNQYLIVRDSGGNVTDVYKWDGESHLPVKVESYKSTYFGTVKPYKGDVYQRCLFNSFATNRITMVHGPAGSGKTVCAIHYLMAMLEKSKIDKIIVFANSIPTLNAAKLGYYPGNKDDKLKSLSLGNILSSKLGDQCAVERLISENKLSMIPMCDIRGFDTTGMNAGVLITEAQNFDVNLMKIALQRIGEDSICIIDGDYNAQVDSEQYAGANNGMRRLSEVFRGQDFYGEVQLQSIYRSRIAEIAERM